MDSNFKNNVENICVGIFQNGNSYTAKILPVDFDLGRRDVARNIFTMETEQPVSIRSFPEMILALGYCNVINQLSKESVERIMQIANKQ